MLETYTVKERELMFQDTLKKWKDTHDECAFETMWLLIQNCCSNIIKKKLTGISIGADRFYDRLMEATALCMHYIVDNGSVPSKLSSFCYLPCIGILYGKHAKQEDSEVSYEEQVDLQNYIEAVDIDGNYVSLYTEPLEEIRGICRPELMNTID